MVNPNHTYKVVNHYGAIYVTYDSIDDARQFKDNIKRGAGVRLFIIAQKPGGRE